MKEVATIILLVGEPMGLFIAREKGALSEVSTCSISIAGAEYNVAVGLSRLSHDVLYLTKLGTDPLGDKIIAGMHDNGIKTDLVQRTGSMQTGMMMKSLVADGDPEIAYFRKGSAASTMEPSEVEKLDFTDCNFLHLTGIYPAISESASAVVQALIRKAKLHQMQISFDPNLRPQLWKSKAVMIETLNLMAGQAHTVLPGVSEGEILTGFKTPEDISNFYHEMGVKKVIVKLGARGSYYSELNGEAGYAKGFHVSKIIDTVGAGDGFAVGVISVLAEGGGVKEAAIRGNAIGAIQLTHSSDNEGLPNRERLLAVIRSGAVE